MILFKQSLLFARYNIQNKKYIYEKNFIYTYIFDAIFSNYLSP